MFGHFGRNLAPGGEGDSNPGPLGTKSRVLDHSAPGGHPPGESSPRGIIPLGNHSPGESPPGESSPRGITPWGIVPLGDHPPGESPPWGITPYVPPWLPSSCRLSYFYRDSLAKSFTIPESRFRGICKGKLHSFSKSICSEWSWGCQRSLAATLKRPLEGFNPASSSM